MDVTRRQWLKLLLAISALVASIVAGVLRTLSVLQAASARPETALTRALRENFAYLQIPDGVIDRFVRDYEAERGAGAARQAPGSGEVYGLFLLSTDFFQEGADVGRPLRYVAYYSPYRSPCYNPLARFRDA